MDLAAYLERHDIIHPTSVKSVQFEAPRRISFEVQGWPWWRGNDGNSDHGARARITIFGLSDCQIQLDHLGTEWEEDLEDFEILRTESIQEYNGGNGAVYANAPVPDPFSLLVEVDAFLVKTESILQARDILNTGRSLREFRRIMGAPGSLVARGPCACIDVVEAELDRQGIPTTVFREEKSGGYPPLFIRLFEGHTFADKVELEEV